MPDTVSPPYNESRYYQIGANDSCNTDFFSTIGRTIYVEAFLNDFFKNEIAWNAFELENAVVTNYKIYRDYGDGLQFVQDILPIGARAVSVAEDKAVRERIAKVTSRSKDLGQAAAEQSAAIGAMSETVRHLKEQLVILADENTRLCRDNSALKERLKILRNGGVEPPFI